MASAKQPPLTSPIHDQPPPSYEASVSLGQIPPAHAHTDNPSRSSTSSALSSAPLQQQYTPPNPMQLAWARPACGPSSPSRAGLEHAPGCCCSAHGGCCFSDHGGCCFSDNGGCCFSDNGGCCFSDNGGCFFSDRGGCCFGDGGGCCCSDPSPGRTAARRG